MKNSIIILLTSFFILTGCEQQPKNEEDSTLEHKTEKIIHSIKEGDVEIISIEGCEYIVYKEAEGANHAYGYMAHKGNCSNSIHCRSHTAEEGIKEK